MSIKKNFFYSTILTTANYVFPFLTYPYVSRILGVEKIGMCNFADSIIHYFILFSMLGISSVGIREIAKCQNDKSLRSKVFSSLFCITAVSTLLALIILFICTLLVPQLFQYRILMGIGALKILSNFLLVEWLFKGMEDFKYITQRTLIVKFLYVGSVFIFVKDESDYIVYYFLLTLMIMINALINVLYARKYISISFKCNWVVYIKPLIIMWIYALLTNMYTTFNTSFLGFQSGEIHVGYFSTATKIYSLLIAIYSAFTGVMMPRMSKLISDGNRDEYVYMLTKSRNLLLAFSLPLMIYCCVYAADIIKVIAGPGYEGAILPLRITMPLIIIIGYEQILIVQGLLPMKKDKLVLLNSCIGASIGIVGCIVFIPMYNSVGASFVWLLAEIGVMIAASINMKRIIGFSNNITGLARSVVGYVPITFILLLINNSCLEMEWRLIIGAISMIFFTHFIQKIYIKNDVYMNCTDEIFKRIKTIRWMHF